MPGTKMSSLFAWSCLMFTIVLQGVIILILEMRLNEMLCPVSHSVYAVHSHSVFLTLCEPMNISPPGSSVPGILQARILEWVTTCIETESESRSVVSDSLPPHDYRVHGILQARTLEWVASPFSRGSSRPRDQTQVSRIAGRFFTSWATREAQEYWNG